MHLQFNGRVIRPIQCELLRSLRNREFDEQIAEERPTASNSGSVSIARCHGYLWPQRLIAEFFTNRFGVAALLTIQDDDEKHVARFDRFNTETCTAWGEYFAELRTLNYESPK